MSSFRSKRTGFQSCPCVSMGTASMLVLALLVLFACTDKEATGFKFTPAWSSRAPLNEVLPGLYRLEDTCNVYVLKHGEAAVLVDSGSGEIIDRLQEIGVRKVEETGRQDRLVCHGGRVFQGCIKVLDKQCLLSSIHL